MMNKTMNKETTKTIFETPTYHRGRSLEEQQERHRAGTGHTRVGKLGARLNKVTNMIHVFQECLECKGEEEPNIDSVSPYTTYDLEPLDKKGLLFITSARELPGNKQTSKTKLIETILKSY